jgi:hypothetical protein
VTSSALVITSYRDPSYFYWYTLIAKMFRAAPSDGLVMEFGVCRGRTINEIAEIAHPRTVYGFDSFDGLPEDWKEASGRVHIPRGEFRCSKPTSVRENVILVDGMFQNTLPQFLAQHPEPASFVHIDCDLYSSTSFVLSQLKDRVDGAVIAFDEVCGSALCEDNEGRALAEFLASFNYDCTLLGHQHGQGSGFKLTRKN